VVVTAIPLAHWRECILGGGLIDDRVLLLRLYFDVDDGAGDMGHSRPGPGRHTWSAATLASAAIDAAFAARLLEGARERRTGPAIPLTRPRPSIYVAPQIPVEVMHLELPSKVRPTFSVLSYHHANPRGATMLSSGTGLGGTVVCESHPT
jgi:hypothetical protein